MKKNLINIFIFLILISVILLILLKRETNEVNFYFFPFKDADASIITYKEKIIIVDTGEQKNEEEIKIELKERNIKKIDYLILTHPDKDHIGNAQFLVENFEIGEIFQTDYDKGSNLQDDLNKAIEERNIKNQIVTESLEIKIEELIINIIPPKRKYEDSNNNSLIVKFDFNNKKALYTGDIREERVQDILGELEEVDLLKYPYHGRELYTDLIDKTKPKMTVITGNDIDEDIIQKLNDIESKIRYTSEQQIEIIFE